MDRENLKHGKKHSGYTNDFNFSILWKRLRQGTEESSLVLVMFLILKNDCGYRGFHCISFTTLARKYFITEKKNSDSRGQKT